MNYITDFTKSRKSLIGSSDVPALIQHPEKYESLAGYERTALTVYMEKTGQVEREPAGLAAEIGRHLELLILKKCIAEIDSPEVAEEFERGYLLCELAKTKTGYHDAESFQNTKWLHHTEAVNEHSVSHADVINIEDGILIEAKMSLFWSSRRGDDPYKGYDFDIEGRQGIPLKHYFQTEHQAALYNLVYGIKPKKIIVPIITDGKFHLWKYKPDLKNQEKILELCSYMKQCIDTKTPPKILAMNSKDIKALYPKINEDFKILSGDDLESAMIHARAMRDCANQEKAWKAKKEDAQNALSVFLKDTKILKGIVDGELKSIASWQERKASESIMPYSEIKKDKDKLQICIDNGLIRPAGDPSKFVVVKIKE
ncbi:MAG: hypothetical protein M0P35_10810 [Bacteroidales bacterium]|nr:hypothetical protein [Bacteroidales bacterium]